MGDRPLRRVTEELGGWPIILQEWDSDSFVLETVLAKISHEYDAKILIHCYVGADDKNSSSNIIQVRRVTSVKRDYFPLFADSPG